MFKTWIRTQCVAAVLAARRRVNTCTLMVNIPYTQRATACTKKGKTSEAVRMETQGDAALQS